MAPDTANRFVRHSFRLLTHGWDSQWRELKVWSATARVLARKSRAYRFISGWARPASAGPGSREPSRVASRPSGFDPSRKSCGVPRRGHSGKGPAAMKYAGVAITAPFPGTLLTGLVAALGPACRLRRRYAHAPAGAISRRRCAPWRTPDQGLRSGQIAQQAESKSAGSVFP
jgi:hypothetical protein